MKFSNLLSACVVTAIGFATINCSHEAKWTPASPPPIGSPGEAKTATKAKTQDQICKEREAEMNRMQTDAQERLMRSYRRAFRGGPGGDSGTLREDLRRFEETYSSTHCDGLTNSSFRDQINRFLVDIERFR